ncbi:glycosyltransferase family 10 domain-containing protein [Tichowtungia aerotolerans]|uniref:Fucosyltransferase C-terminal domain-containing protein n=1 Tax=Tichowtungia aerotolerans TaxID=2697043 RepID=A0A6P1M2I6_9BACT|nr:glycosyltransferase family 10 [Tichowtungia aerotolerans]QHI68061.1 hypothetical protein GT409_00865 [Tichowtungia aerotolerans]
MLRINIVYQNKNMPADVLPPIDSPDGAYTVTWSRLPLAGVDAVVYFNHYTFDRRIHQRVCPDALKILYMYEPPAIDPMQYTRRVWKQFDAVLTWNTYLTESSSAFTFEAGAYFDLPYCSDYGVPMREAVDPKDREKAICQICGDKYSLSVEEIYSERRRVARWFHENASTRMDVFGRPPMEVPNYRGECGDKAEIMARYRYALCFENTWHPLWTRGYLTEKILDCMASGTIPVYYGCSNIEELVPPDCFIDYRKFNDLKELDALLLSMTDDEYAGYARRMQSFVREYNAPVRHSAFRLYETVAVVCSRPLDPKKGYPEDYAALSSFNGKLRLAAMRILLPYHRFVYPAFAMVRVAKKRITK